VTRIQKKHIVALILQIDYFDKICLLLGTNPFEEDCFFLYNEYIFFLTLMPLSSTSKTLFSSYNKNSVESG
jgi:hypothetical protein